MLFDGLAGALPQVSPPLLASAALLGGLVLWVLGVGLGRSEWRDMVSGLRQIGRGAAMLGRGVCGAVGWVAAMFAPLRDGGANIAAVARRAPRSRRATADARASEEDAGGVGADGLVSGKSPPMKAGRKAKGRSQGAFDFDEQPVYKTPALELLQFASGNTGAEAINRTGLEQNARMLKTVLDDFGVRGEIVKVRPGPVITLYELEPAPGTKSARVIALADDIARSMSAISARVAVVPGRNVIGIELPNAKRESVSLRELLASEAFERHGSGLTLALGKDIGGGPVFVELARMPHLLIAGTTGSGKSVAINAMILSLLYRLSPEACEVHPDRSEDAGAFGLRRHPAPADAGGHRAGQGGGGVEVDGARDGGPLPGDVATGRAQYRRLQRPHRRGETHRRNAGAPRADRLRRQRDSRCSRNRP